MGNTTEITGNLIFILQDGSTDWIWKTELTLYPHSRDGGVRIKRIDVRGGPGGATGDIVTIRNGTLTGNRIYVVEFLDAYGSDYMEYNMQSPVKPHFESDENADSYVWIHCVEDIEARK
jgi:hypothetical protein